MVVSLPNHTNWLQLLLLSLLFLVLWADSCHAWAMMAPSLSWSSTTTPERSHQPLSTTALTAKRSKGFGSSTTTTASSAAKKKGKKRTSQSGTAKTTLPLVTESKSIQDVLHPRLKDPAVLEDIKTRLRAGEVVIIQDAFVPELADAMHAELEAIPTDSNGGWDHNEDYHSDGYHYRHYNIYDKTDFPPLCVNLHKNIFESDETKQFMTELTGRDCTGDSVSGAPSYYGSGDHSLPHTDHIGQRSVAYIWHLSRNWKPEWGGALYWAPEPLANAFHHASFNSLVLFSVTPHSAHFVTTVSPNAREKRLGYNGWWHSSWVPTAQDPLEDLLATPEQRLMLTHAQVLALQDMLDDPWAPRIQPPERHEQIESLRGKIMEELYPPALSSISSTLEASS